MKKAACAILLALMVAVPAWSQKKHLDSKESHYRTIGIDTVITDAKGHKTPAHAAGKLAFVVHAYSKDGKYVLVEYVAANYADHDDFRKAVAAARDPHLMAFDKGLAKREVFEPVLKLAGFPDVDLNKAFVRVP